MSTPKRSLEESRHDVDHEPKAKKKPDSPSLKSALRCGKLGWPVFPVYEREGDGSKNDKCGCKDPECKNQGKHPSPQAPHGFKDATTDEKAIRHWWRWRPKAGIGIATGKVSGIIVIDLDRKNGKDGVKVLKELEGKLGPLPVTATAQTPSNGLHYYYRYEEGIGSNSDVLGPGVDIRGDRGYIVAPPSHNGLYKWVDENAYVEVLPEAWVKHIQGLFASPDKKPKTKAHAGKKPSLGDIEAALAAIKNDTAASRPRNEWINVGQAVWQGTDGSADGFALFKAWSQQWSGYDEDATRKAWDSFHPTEITVGTLFHMANEADPSWRDRLAQHGLDGRIVLSKQIPLESAKKFVEHLIANDHSHLRFFHGTLYRWTGTHYVAVERKAVRTAVYAFLDTKASVHDKKTGAVVPFNPRPANVNEIIDCLESDVHQQVQMVEHDPPFWIAGSEHAQRDPAAIIAFRNGLLDLKTRELLPHDPLFFNVNCLPFDYDRNAKAPQWNRFLRDLWPGNSGETKGARAEDANDKRARLTLGEIFGLMLTPDTSFHKIFMLVGPPRGGRGTIGRVLAELLGRDNVGGPTLAQLTTQFGLQDLIDKRLAIVGDARLGKNTDRIAERLLSISGGDKQQIDIKYRAPWTGYMSLRFLILTNELPRIPDMSGTLPTRFILLMMRNSFLGREDVQLTDKLKTELPGILNWALRGLDRLRKRGYFEMPQASLDAMQMLEDLASPVRAFVRERCETEAIRDADGKRAPLRVHVKVLWAAYRQWCEGEGQEVGSQVVFGRNLKAAVPHVMAAGRHPDRYYRHIQLREEAGREQRKPNRV